MLKALCVPILLVLAIFCSGLEAASVCTNNPFNIRFSKHNDWVGQVGSYNGFVIFDTAEHGERAARLVLSHYRYVLGIKTIERIIYRWAPPVENDTENYIKFVVRQTGIKRNVELRIRDYENLLFAMEKMEGGRRCN